jgi:exonuclease SbcC
MKDLLSQLKQFSVVVADTGDFASIKKYQPRDATTNPSLLLKASEMPEYSGLIDKVLADTRQSGLAGAALVDAAMDRLAVAFGIEILKIVPQRVSTEVDARLSFDKAATLAKARVLMGLYEKAGIPRERILIKIASTWEGIQAARELKAEGIALQPKADTLKQLIVSLLGERTLPQDREWHEQQVTTTEKAGREHEAKVHALQTQAASTKARREQLEVRVNELAAQLANREPITAAMISELEQAARRISDELATQQKFAGIFEERLRSDDAARHRRDTGGAELQAAEAVALRWGRLKELIGSADGAKFSRFAQSLTLRQLIGLANNHLALLAERYRLMAADGDELDLRIVDLYQANVDRPMESLSGGESFLASLALALGLSELASRHHPIDSLFIDEGFGTLDSETLEIALSALENLRASGKTIGLISHVELLKERLTTQVRVLRGTGGTSRIEVAA